MANRRPGRVAVLAAVLLAASGCAQATSGAPRPNTAASDEILVKAGFKAFHDHFANLGDEHAKVYNFLNYGDTELKTEHESYKLGDPPMTVLERHRASADDRSAVLHPPDDPYDYVRLDEEHANLAPTPWVATPSLYKDGFETCFLLTAWLACHLDNAIAQTKAHAQDKPVERARRTEHGVEVTTGAQLGLMIDEGFIGIPANEEAEVSAQMRDQIVPVTITFDADMKFTGFEIRGKVDDGRSQPLELQIGYEVLGEATPHDFPDKPAPSETTTIDDPEQAEKFWDAFNSSAATG